MGWTCAEKNTKKTQLSLPINLTEDEHLIAEVLTTKGSLAVDELAFLTGLQQSKLVHTILGMEMQGVLISLPGKVYKLV
jgi:DNA processing protein